MGTLNRLETSVYKRGGHDEVTTSQIIKWIISIVLLVTGVIFLTRFFSSIMRFFGLDKETQDKKENEKNDELETDKHLFDWGGAGNINEHNTDLAGAVYGKSEPIEKIRALVDEIWRKLVGNNWNTYEEIVNRLKNLTLSDCKLACNYWYGTYRAGTNKNFYQFISGESHGGKYDPALAALKKTGYYNTLQSQGTLDNLYTFANFGAGSWFL